MASGRVGGTKSMKSGLLGSNVYQVRKNADGTYSQIISEKGVTNVSFTTPRLQAQRMCTGMVESLMRQLKKVASISMQSAVNKSKSLNAFSSFNLQLLARDCQANWYGNNRFVYPRCNKSKLYTDDLGGEWMISAGTLQFNLFKEFGEDLSWGRDYLPPYNYRMEYYSMRWDAILGRETVGDFLRRYRITRIDTIVMCGFLVGQRNYNSEDGSVQEFYQHLYLILNVNPLLPDDALLTADNVGSLFTGDSNWDVRVCVRENLDGFAMGWLVENADTVNLIPYMAGFSISYLDGKKKISSSIYKNAYGQQAPWLANAAPTNVFGSWIGDPTNLHYPSIF